MKNLLYLIIIVQINISLAQRQIKIEYQEMEFGKITPCVLYVKDGKSVYIQNPQWKTTIKEETEIGGQNNTPKIGKIVRQRKSTSLIKDYSNKKVYIEIFNSDYNYYMEDELPDYAWQITKETKKIGNYTTIKAISKKYRGRIWEVWFATEIPIKEGPWKFKGLPGLILEAQDDAGSCIIQAKSIDLNNREIVDFQRNLQLPIKSREESKKLSEERMRKIDEKLKNLGFKDQEGTEKVQYGKEIW